MAKIALEQKMKLWRLELQSGNELDQEILEARLKTEPCRLKHEIAIEQEKAAARRSEEKKDLVARLKQERM